MLQVGIVTASNYYQADGPKKTSRSATIFTRRHDIKEVHLEEFAIMKVLGRGSFGKVCLVEYTPTKEIYAMKSLKKDVLLDQDQIENTLLEKKILQSLDHPFLVGLVFCFQTEERIYFIMPFLRGGELFQHLRKFRIFDEEK
jgi:serine/threonine protein kinase